jgi:hypothetical protein
MSEPAADKTGRAHNKNVLILPEHGSILPDRKPGKKCSLLTLKRPQPGCNDLPAKDEST